VFACHRLLAVGTLIKELNYYYYYYYYYNGKTTLRWIFGKQGLGMWIGFIGLRIGTGGGLL
jgi:hypothetical protein